MNKLVSRNPVLRFKLGRKIVFAKPGDKMLYNGKEIVTEEVLNGQTIYRRKNGSYVYKNSKLLSPIKSTSRTTSKSKTTSSVDLGSSEVNRFAIASRKNGTRYFNTAEKAKAYLKTLPSGSSIFRDMGEEWKGLVVKADRTQGKDTVATSYGRKQAEKYNHLSQKDAYKAALKSGNKYFAYRGRVYKTDLKDGKDNMTEMQGLYGTHLGWGKDPKLQNKQSRIAREKYRSQIDAKQGNRRPSYQGKTNSQANAEADKLVALRWNEKQFMDLMLPTPANMINYGIDIITGNYPSKPHVSGLNIPGIFTDLTEGNYKDAGFRTLDLGLSFAPGARVNMTPGGTNVTGGSVLLPNGTRTFSKWLLNSLGKNAVSPMEGVLRSPKGTLYFIDNGQFMKDISLPLMISNIPVQRTYDLEK